VVQKILYYEWAARLGITGLVSDLKYPRRISTGIESNNLNAYLAASHYILFIY
jgi:hypothetical protein